LSEKKIIGRISFNKLNTKPLKGLAIIIYGPNTCDNPPWWLKFLRKENKCRR
jgi:hypothetical protein